MDVSKTVTNLNTIRDTLEKLYREADLAARILGMTPMVGHFYENLDIISEAVEFAKANLDLASDLEWQSMRKGLAEVLNASLNACQKDSI